MTTGQIKNFFVLYDSLSFSKAAAELFISEQALSKSISKLEEELGFPLFVRAYHRLLVTEEGKALYNFLSHAVSELDVLVRSLRPAPPPEMQLLSVGYGQLADMSAYMTEKIRGFKTRDVLPMLMVERIESEQVSEYLLSGRLDLCFSYPGYANAPPLECFPVQKQKMMLCVSENNPHYHPGFTPEDYLREELYEIEGYQSLELHNRSGAFRHVLEEYIEREKLQVRMPRIVTVPSLEAWRIAQEAGMGIAVAPENNRVVMAPKAHSLYLGIDVYTYCVYNADNPNPLARSFIEYLKEDAIL